ncbi:imidazolonepropionase [Rhodovibrio salinarum]|uniref:Imidazolonepropionase n=1 Tax=Rhodovibrio salinarum TaxID=1087 RepID=A0A934QJL2_9PROT|nr:imidazolonepropionase [Rhodovibrio salinarum]MBK1698092.1 imidazolonepropionase [Rhodovibrio salinarum]
MWDTLWLDARLATMAPGTDRPYGAIEGGALAIEDGRIAWLGKRDELQGAPEKLAKQVHWVEGRWITPGLIDCHTHLAHGGNRASEFERRLLGDSDARIQADGGGISATVDATRAARDNELYEASSARLAPLLAEGVTTLEIKSGYGLCAESEMKQLRVARQLGRDYPLDVVTSFLGAHTVPPEFEDDCAAYIRAVTEQMLPAIVEAGLADAVDVFCGRGGFDAELCEWVLAAARGHGLPVKLHADQLSDSGGAELAARYGALSADHLEYANADGVAALARSGTVATLLPGAFYCLRGTRKPPIAAFREAGVPMAIATDSNPGSAPVTSILLMLSMGCTLFDLTPEEALAGVTREAARALGLLESRGTLEIGKRADLCVWEIDRPAELAYRVGFNPIAYVVKQGRARG